MAESDVSWVTGLKTDEVEFFSAVGLFIASWSGLEFVMSIWFVHLLQEDQQPRQRASLHLIFASGRNFRTKLDLLEAAAAGYQDADVRKFALKATAKANQFATFRNRVAHDQYMTVFHNGTTRTQIQSHKELMLSENPILTGNIERALHRVQQLTKIMTLVLARNGGLTPQEGLEQVAALPSAADHPLSSPTPPKSQPQTNKRPRSKAKKH